MLICMFSPHDNLHIHLQPLYRLPLLADIHPSLELEDFVGVESYWPHIIANDS